VSPRALASSTNAGVVQRVPPRTRRNSARRFSVTSLMALSERRLATCPGGGSSGRKALAALRAPPRQDPHPAGSLHTFAEAMATLADKPARLIGAFHVHTPMWADFREKRGRARNATPVRGVASGNTFSRSIRNAALIGGASLQVKSTKRGKRVVAGMAFAAFSNILALGGFYLEAAFLLRNHSAVRPASHDRGSKQAGEARTSLERSSPGIKKGWSGRAKKSIRRS
jgi:hypothetical protein